MGTDCYVLLYEELGEVTAVATSLFAESLVKSAKEVYDLSLSQAEELREYFTLALNDDSFLHIHTTVFV